MDSEPRIISHSKIIQKLVDSQTEYGVRLPTMKAIC
jgi:hypothetical protein